MARTFKFRVSEGQSIYDLGVQFFGNENDAFKIVENNDNIESLEDDIVGKTIEVEMSNEVVVKFFRSLESNISTN